MLPWALCRTFYRKPVELDLLLCMPGYSKYHFSATFLIKAIVGIFLFFPQDTFINQTIFLNVVNRVTIPVEHRLRSFVLRIMFPSLSLLFSDTLILQGYSKWLSGSYTIHSRCNPIRFLSMGLRQGSGFCSFSSRKYPGTEPPLKPSPLTYGTNSIIVLMFVESQRVLFYVSSSVSLAQTDFSAK